MMPAASDPALRRMKAVALALLAGAALLYVVATALGHRHPAWGYLAAFAEAAMVGAIADWFAVVALFRHPLGLPIPHTAIIPANKDRIGAKLADFLCTHFLGTPQVLAKLQTFDAAGRLAGWLADPGHAERAAAQLGGALRYAVDTLDAAPLRRGFGEAVLRRLERVDGARVCARALGLLTAEGRHQGLVDALLGRIAGLLDDERLQAEVARAIASEVQVLRYVGLDEKVGRYATGKLVAGVTRLVGEMAADRAHPLRARLDAWLVGLVDRLESDPELREEVGALQRRLLEQPALAAYLHGLWADAIDWLRRDLDRADASRLRARTAGALQFVGRTLHGDAALRGWINQRLERAAPRWIERYREDIRAYVVQRVEGWDAREMTAELERHIGRDLQFIRVNGTLVGGLVGLMIHTLTVWIG